MLMPPRRDRSNPEWFFALQSHHHLQAQRYDVLSTVVCEVDEWPAEVKRGQRIHFFN